MTTSEQLERETEMTRAEIVGALTELRERMTPGRIVDEAFDFARDGRAGQFVRNLGRQAADNPIPVVLIGAGLAWLMMGGRAAHNGSRVVVSGAASGAAAAVADASQRAARTGGQIKDTAAGIVANANRTAHDWTGRAEFRRIRPRRTCRRSGKRRRPSRASRVVRGRQRGRLYGTTSQSARQAAGGLASFLKEEPMVLAGIGIALGAALGAALPGERSGKPADGRNERRCEGGRRRSRRAAMGERQGGRRGHGREGVGRSQAWGGSPGPDAGPKAG